MIYVRNHFLRNAPMFWMQLDVYLDDFHLCLVPGLYVMTTQGPPEVYAPESPGEDDNIYNHVKYPNADIF